MKFQNPIVFFIMLIVSIFLYCKNGPNAAIDTGLTQEYKLIVERGGFHYDRFEVTPSQITYFPQENSQHLDIKYNSISKSTLDSIQTMEFFEELIEKGFWDLKNKYQNDGSCTSMLRITFIANGKRKVVVCEDFDSGCHNLIKDIDSEVIDMEGNDLKRIYLPG